MVDLSGLFAPVTTPFDPITGDLDVVALRRNVRSLLETELTGVVLFGTTGEGVLVEDEERIAALRGIREVVPDRLVLAAAGAESTRRAIALSRLAAEHGADAVLVAPPAFFRPQMTPEALREHYVAIADASPVPLLLYQVPTAYAGVELRAGLVAALASHPNIVGIKDSSGDLQSLGALVEAAPSEFVVLAGSGSILYGALEVGARGGIVAIADLAPDACCELVSRKHAGDEAGAGKLQERLAPLHRSIVAAHGVPGMKAAVDLLGGVGGPPRMPLRPLRPKDVARVRDALVGAGLLARGPERSTVDLTDGLTRE